MLGGDGQERRHDLARIAGGRADPEPSPAQRVDRLARPGDEPGVVRHDAGVERDEDLVDAVDVGVGRIVPCAFLPGGGDARRLHQGLDMLPFRHAHGSPRLVDRDVDAEVSEDLDERAHRRT